MLRYGKSLRVREENLDRAEGWFARHGDLLVLGARRCPLPAASSRSRPTPPRMPLVRFAVLTAVGSSLWNAVLLGAAYALGANWDRVSRGSPETLNCKKDRKGS